MFPAPAPEAAHRMHDAYGHARTLLGVAAAEKPQVWGYMGRTLSGPAHDMWLRLVSAPAGKGTGKLWDGPAASRALPHAVRRPELLDLADWDEADWQYRAELYVRAAAPAVSPSPVLDEAPALSEEWWTGLHDSLAALSRVRTERVAVREEYVRRAVPQYTGHTVDSIEWATGHGDLHWANLTAPDMLLLDWEGWGTAPVGYDAAGLLLHSLPVPDVATRVRTEFAALLNAPESRVGQLAACAELLQAAPRVPFYADLEGAVRDHLKALPPVR
ncbi:hypothetical protein [Streptomyces boluensis]|uniref:Aminoglycoside phosphotransferase n=1 Tax=Streptomyces boluensis TaxID=1775135 RepID=A0A964UVX6_9ACTN|nr:hypothetical protein [Streptomyces boluensis]NBE53867.1 hypothetical protein [Streptomyces boluensis]